jgi:hypothetical protein
MAELSRRLSFHMNLVYSPDDVLKIFTHFYDSGYLDFDYCKQFKPINADYLLDQWRSKGYEKIASISYMSANNAIPILIALDQRAETEEFKTNIQIYVIDIFKALNAFNSYPTIFFEKLRQVRQRIADDYIWHRALEHLENQILFVLDEFGYNRTKQTCKIVI